MLKEKLTILDLCLIGIFAAITAVMAQISIPMPMGVPMTMQTFAISLAGMLLGSRRGFLSALVYVLLGAFGMPVFTAFRGGIGVIFSPTGGFILSFPLMAWLIGLGAERMPSKALVTLGLISGTAVNYICGMLMYSAVTGNNLRIAFTACVLPFIPTAVAKAVAAGLLGVKLRARGILSVYATWNFTGHIPPLSPQERDNTKSLQLPPGEIAPMTDTISNPDQTL